MPKHISLNGNIWSHWKRGYSEGWNLYISDEYRLAVFKNPSIKPVRFSALVNGVEIGKFDKPEGAIDACEKASEA